MTYIWKTHNYPANWIGEYDARAAAGPTVRFAVEYWRLTQYDMLANTMFMPLVSETVVGAVKKLCGAEIQADKVRVQCRDHTTDRYYFIKPLVKREAIEFDREGAQFAPVGTALHIVRWRALPGGLGPHHLVRDTRYVGNVIVSATLKQLGE